MDCCVKEALRTSGLRLFLPVVVLLLTAGSALLRALEIPDQELPKCSHVVNVDRVVGGVDAVLAPLKVEQSVLVALATDTGVHYDIRADFIDPETGKVVCSCKNENVSVAFRAAAGSSSSSAQLSPALALGTFRLGGTYDTGAQPYAVAVGDFNRVGNMNLAVANYGDGGSMGPDPAASRFFLAMAGGISPWARRYQRGSTRCISQPPM